MEQMPTTSRPFGDHLREWRTRRRMSQLDFSLEAEISQKHLSFIESGRSTPSRDMVIHLAERLDIPLRERNTMLLAAGYAPMYLARSIDDPSLKPALEAIHLILKSHAPFPSIALDRHWNLIAHNEAAGMFLGDITDPELLKPPVNILRLSLHPGGLAPRVHGLAAWRQHVFERLRHQIALTADPVLMQLLTELLAYPCPKEKEQATPMLVDPSEVFVKFTVDLSLGRLSFFSTITVFGTPIDVTLSEIALETFFPADEETRRLIQTR
jgi:transcriptional regulator with XRE-family HTH domain